jgi:hypothetical protein
MRADLQDMPAGTNSSPYFRRCAGGGQESVFQKSLSPICHAGIMKVLIGTAAGWIAFYTVDQALFGGRLVPALSQLAKGILTSFSVWF